MGNDQGRGLGVVDGCFFYPLTRANGVNDGERPITYYRCRRRVFLHPLMRANGVDN